MNPQPPAPSYPRDIGVAEPIAPAYDRMKQMLFRPFDLAQWITIGFCAWLAGLGESGFRGGFNGFQGGNHNFGSGGQPQEQFRHFYGHARDYVAVNLGWLVPLAIAVFLLGAALWLVLLWFNSRGKFLFLNCVARDTAEVAVPWNRFAAPANSLFRFRVVLGLAGMIISLPLLAFMILGILHMALQGEVDVAGVLTAIGLGLVLVFVGLGFALLRKFLLDFVVPIQFLRGGNCMAAWREFLALLAANAGNFTLYILFQIVLTWAIGLMVLLLVLLTCCIAGCLMLLPFLGTVVLLPVLVFKRAYSLYYLAQFGPPFDVFLAPTGSDPGQSLPPPVAGMGTSAA